MRGNSHSGFTLIELSIVLVIIGLVVGGVLVGRDLIEAAAIRAQVSQIEKYQTAVNTFRGKYNALPGDMSATTATQIGFAARGTGPGEGDGDGQITGVSCNGNIPGGFTPAITCPVCQGGGETLLFWEDLSQANLISGSFTSPAGTGVTALGTAATGAAVDIYLPPSKLGRNTHVYVYSGGLTGLDNYNYFGLSAIGDIGGFGGWDIDSPIGVPGLSVIEASNIDTKMDDGYPQTGRVIAAFPGSGPAGWAIGGTPSLGGAWWTTDNGANPGTAASPTSGTCYDNGGNASALMQYTMGQNGGNGINCALSFRFQ